MLYYLDENFNQIKDKKLPVKYYKVNASNYPNFEIETYIDNTIVKNNEKELEKLNQFLLSLNEADFLYLKSIKNILDNGIEKKDRTGVGTISVFGTETRYDLSKGFPLLTTKKLSIKNISSELTWFISGDTNRKYLKDRNNPIWNLWDRPYSITNRGTVYRGGIYDELNVEISNKTLYADDSVLGKEYLKFQNDISIEWEDFEVFKSQIKELPHYKYFKSGEALVLDKLNDNYPLSPKNAWFISEEEKNFYKNNNLINMKFNIIDDDNLGPIYGKQWRDFNGIDQLDWVINEIKTNPNSRRLIVSAWNPSDIPDMALPPCHTMFLFNVTNNKLSCKLFQRSADFPIGVPYNIASYAILVHLIAKECNLEVGEFIHTTGDSHIYLDQIEMIKEQLNRLPYKAPELKINNFKSIYETQPEEIEIINYESHPFIKMPVAK